MLRFLTSIHRLLVVVLVGSGLAVCLWWGPRTVLLARASHDWPTVPGVVEASDAVLRSSGGSSGRSSSLHAEIVYRYEVEGTTHRGTDTWVPGTDFMRKGADVRAVVKAHPVGATIDVYIDPDDPETTCLVPGGESRGWGLVGFGVLLAAVGAYFARRRRGRKPRRTSRPGP